jgi:hypothetical protein
MQLAWLMRSAGCPKTKFERARWLTVSENFNAPTARQLSFTHNPVVKYNFEIDQLISIQRCMLNNHFLII